MYDEEGMAHMYTTWIGRIAATNYCTLNVLTACRGTCTLTSCKVATYSYKHACCHSLSVVPGVPVSRLHNVSLSGLSAHNP